MENDPAEQKRRQHGRRTVPAMHFVPQSGGFSGRQAASLSAHIAEQCISALFADIGSFKGQKFSRRGCRPVVGKRWARSRRSEKMGTPAGAA